MQAIDVSRLSVCVAISDNASQRRLSQWPVQMEPSSSSLQATAILTGRAHKWAVDPSNNRNGRTSDLSFRAARSCHGRLSVQ